MAFFLSNLKSHNDFMLNTSPLYLADIKILADIKFL